MTKITAEHVGRGAFVYVRQSTADQRAYRSYLPRTSDMTGPRLRSAISVRLRSRHKNALTRWLRWGAVRRNGVASS